MHDPPPLVYRFGSFELHPEQRLLIQNGKPLRLAARSFDVLIVLIENRDRVVSKEALMEKVWGDVYVEEANLAVHISGLRKLFSSESPQAVAIETFPKQGYRLVCELGVDISSARAQAPKTSPDQSSAPSTDLGGKRRPWRLVGGSVLLGVAIVAGYAFFTYYLAVAPQQIQVTRVQGVDKSPFFSISPNGEYVAHDFIRDGKRGLLLAHISTRTNIQLLEPEDSLLFLSITFSRDGKHVYFVKSKRDIPNTLYRLPFLGGKVEKILENVDGRIGFSPDGKRFAFYRKGQAGNTALMTADSEGSDEKLLASMRHPDHFSRVDVAWSPDGKLVTAGLFLRSEITAQFLVNVDVESGRLQPFLPDEGWAGWESFVWLPDGSGLVASIRKEDTVHNQLYILPFPSGRPVRLFPGDLGGHRTVSLTSDGKTLLAESYSHNTEVWHAGPSGTDAPTPITDVRHHFFRLLRWAPDGKIVFSSNYGGNRDIWTTDGNGGAFEQVTSGRGQNEMPFPTADNEHLVFASNRSGDGKYHIWRSRRDGSEAVQLTFGNGEQFPVVSSDLKWVVYEDTPRATQPEQSALWKIPFQGGEPAMIVPAPSQQADVSPDSRLIACEYKPSPDSKWKIGIFSIDGGEAIDTFDMQEVSPVRWTPDGSMVTVIRTNNGVANLWGYPLDGREPYQITKFVADGIPSYCDWSAEFGLICSRGRVVRDTVLIANFR